jgi:hypothetical protein
MLGIDPDQMLVDCQPRVVVESAYSDVDARFDALPDLPIKERIKAAQEAFFSNIYFAHLPQSFRKAFFERYFEGTEAG